MSYPKRIALFAALAFSFSACKKEATSPDLTLSNNATTSFATSATSSSVISNVVVASGLTNQVSVLIKGSAYYIDRNYAITGVPDSLANLDMIKTANADKSNASSSYMSFNLSQASTVYVAFDPRATSLPTWLKAWTKLKATVSLNDSKVTYYALYSKVFDAGTVKLGGANASGAAGILNQYFVFAKAKVKTSAPIATPSDETTGSTNSFMLGVNGHSLGLPAYMTVSQEDQISLLTKMGMSCYRQNININSDGSIPLSNIFLPLYKAASANGVTILPMINTTSLDFSASESSAYATGKSLGVKTATKNAGYFKYYELGNEIDNKVLKGGNGDVSTDYDANKLKIAAAYLKGLDDGIKSIQPTAQTMIDAGWLHYYFLQYMISYGNKFNIVAWHWYSDMEATATRIKIPDISLKLTSLFNKPIWFTEVGQRPDAVANIEQVQSDFLSNFVKKVKKNPKVGAVLCYELFDEPERASAEKSFGLLKWTSMYDKYSMKIVAQTFVANK
ncbi:glycosyl hydrolase [Mucilaginibacter sp.]|uniref:glycosyl hydrolase n=1 Tax=Mucilaginibacter sp. TaxID=1882438 RepID=UPI0025DF3AD3|nr:glycosyl hydrolase [Mucilaginibacter sp.]